MAKTISPISRLLSGVYQLLFSRPLLKFFMLLAGIFIVSRFSEAFSRLNIVLLLFILTLLASVYFVVLIIVMVRHSLNRLLTAKSIIGLLSSYILFIVGILVLLSLIYSLVQATGRGYLTYSICGDNFSKDMIANDPHTSRDYLYFVATTFFSVGYGDICPMGWDKSLAVITAFIGHIVSVVVLGIVVHYYLKRKED